MEKNTLINEINDHIELANSLKIELPKIIKKVTSKIINAINSNNKIILFGNGGSAADAQHIAAEFTGRFVKERRGLPALALTTDTSALTAIGNDSDFKFVFSKQLQALGNKGDVLLAISTSGSSPDVIDAIRIALNKGIDVVFLTSDNFKDKLVLTQDLVEDLFNKIRYIKPTIND
jgi:D-sedoheptulose 7-phosphate isomerase